MAYVHRYNECYDVHSPHPGLKDGIGVENLQGSGMIAGETSQAYDEVFTLNLVNTT